MALREFVTGSDVCTVPDGAGPSNAAASLANALLGQSSKTQDRLKELPGYRAGSSISAATPLPQYSVEEATHAAIHGEFPGIPALHPGSSTSADVHDFLQSLEGSQAAPFEEFDAIFNQAHRGMPSAQPHVPLEPIPLAPFLQAFLHSGQSRTQFMPMPMPPVDLSVADKCRIRDRSTIMARHLYAEQGNAFADEQVARLLDSLRINVAELPARAQAQWEELYARGAKGHAPTLAEDVAAGAAAAHAAPGAWAGEFSRMSLRDQAGPSTWASEFRQQQQPGGQWADEFQQQRDGWADEFQASQTSSAVTRDAKMTSSAALAQTQALVDTLSANKDPKFQSSNFLKFLSKMSKGELILDNNGVSTSTARQWVDEFGQEGQAAGASTSSGGWAQEFMEEGKGNSSWVEEFADTFADGLDSQWEQEYFSEMERAAALMSGAHGEYRFAPNNPFLADTHSVEKGRELFKSGLLSEAVLAFEAEAQRHPGNAEAWRLLGTVHAENDDDATAIAAMSRALAAAPDHLDVLLALGVSHTNELDQGEALHYLYSWLSKHPSFKQVAQDAPGPPDSSQRLSWVVGLFERGAKAAPGDADIHTALGVLYNLARHYDGAVSEFRAALQIRPQDYSLWNKLGATLANSSHSSEAISAYQKALDLKPNYMRAWTNMGISQANTGNYDASCRYYIRALQLNPRAAAVWGYLRTSLSCAGRLELLSAVEESDMTRLLKELPLA